MKLVILAPSPDYAANAGARIRYGRIASALAAGGVELTIQPIGGFDPRSAECDVVVMSKCYDARSLVAADVLSRRGVKVGIDLFDDYFSQAADSRLGRFRAWLRQIAGMTDFALCSTAATASIVAKQAPGLAVHLLNDPAPAFDDDMLAARCQEKWSTARASGRLQIGWFGIGDNPMFPVGLTDVAAFAGMIGRLADQGLAVDLSILTNARSLDVARLAMISALPVPTKVSLWSEEAEAALLKTSLLCVLPVNFQPFSAAKSLNRAVTALASGCQVLSVGVPLYDALDPLIYRDADNFLEDLEAGDLRLSSRSIATLRERLDATASPSREAAGLASFLRDIVQSPTRGAHAEQPLYLVHGIVTTPAVHNLVRQVGGLSVGSPFCTRMFDFDVLFEAKRGKRLAMLLSETAMARLSPAYRKRLMPRGRTSGQKYWEVMDGSAVSKDEVAEPRSLSLQLALYPSVMRAIAERLDQAFGSGRTLYSEDSGLPFESAA